MKFKEINPEYLIKNLEIPFFNVLHPDINTYSVMAYQPCGDITAKSNNCIIKNSNREKVTNKFTKLFNLAQQNNVDLLLTPEYSCPWKCIKQNIENNIFPELKKLWVICCESIKPSELKDFINSSTNITFIYDEQKVNLNTERMLNSVCYLFKTKSIDGSINKNVIVIQFKTQPMGGNPIELDCLLYDINDYAYIFRNTGTSISLFTLICSDTLGFDFQHDLEKHNLTNPYLIFHPQLNPNPRAENFQKYRRTILKNQNENSNVDILCLNWAHRTTINSNQRTLKYGNSAYYLKSKYINQDDNRILHNDKKGMFYSYWKDKRANVYLFDYNEYVFYFDTHKVSQCSEPAIERHQKRGIEMISRFHFNNEFGWVEKQEANDDLKQKCENDCDIDLAVITNNHSDTINIERLFCLSCGNAIEKDWHLPNNNYHFQIDDYEKNMRMVFLHDPDGKEEKDKLLCRLNKMINTIIKDPGNFPDEFEDLKNDCQIILPDSNYNYFVNAINSKNTPACLVYIGENLEEYAQSVLNNMSDLFNDNQNANRIIVWYNHGGIKYKHHINLPTFTANTSVSKKSYRRTK